MPCHVTFHLWRSNCPLASQKLVVRCHCSPQHSTEGTFTTRAQGCKSTDNPTCVTCSQHHTSDGPPWGCCNRQGQAWPQHITRAEHSCGNSYTSYAHHVCHRMETSGYKTSHDGTQGHLFSHSDRVQQAQLRCQSPISLQKLPLSTASINHDRHCSVLLHSSHKLGLAHRQRRQKDERVSKVRGKNAKPE
jgi:hypothetical protein